MSLNYFPNDYQHLIKLLKTFFSGKIVVRFYFKPKCCRSRRGLEKKKKEDKEKGEAKSWKGRNRSRNKVKEKN